MSRPTPTPADALLDLASRPGAYQELLDRHEGSIAHASYELASLRVASSGYGMPVPSRSDIRAASRSIKAHLGLVTVPSGRAMARELVAAGRPVAGE
jgi:hypothetical protein